MISDDNVKRLFLSKLSLLAKPLKGAHSISIFRGMPWHSWEHQHRGGCNRHLSVFDKFNIIPKYCFDCYKVLVEPRTVMELFKLLIVFDKIKLQNDYTRKCMVEAREGMSGTYKGYIYCRSIEEGKEICKIVEEVVSEDISKNIMVTLKRGCSEYALSYPEYAQIRQDAGAMDYKMEWQKYEDLAEKELVISSQAHVIGAYNSSRYAQLEAHIMLAWLRYAATIEDLSYLKISGRPVGPFTDLKRPQFQPSEDEENIG